MRCDLEGLLQNALDNDPAGEMHDYYQFCITELIGNLRELKQRAAAGDTGVVKEFFDIYVVGEQT